MTHDLLRHIAACRNARLEARRRLWLGAEPVGWVTAEAAVEIESLAGGLTFADAHGFEAMAASLARAGRVRWRNEAFSVRARPDGPELARVDRGALPYLGIWSEGVHVNGLVRRPEGSWLWVARRAADKALDPGKLDHLVAGGVPAGLSPGETLVKEAAEEADIAAPLARQSVRKGQIVYSMDRAEGLRRDRLHCYDLWLPEDFVPHPADGEVADFTLWPLAQVLTVLRETNAFKFNVALVLIDLFLRIGLIDPGSAEGRALRAGLDEPIDES